MSYSKSIAIVLTTAVCATAFAADAGAQSRDRAARRGPTVGRAVPRGNVPRAGGPRFYSPRVISPRVVGRPYYRPHYYGYRPYRSAFSLGFYSGYGYGYPYAYGYPHGSYGYPYRSYGYGPGYRYPYGSYGGYYGASGYAGDVYGGVRIQGAPRDAQVFADGYYAGIVDDFDGVFQRLTLESGAHQIEIRVPGLPPMTYDVNVPPGDTLTIHANVR